MVIANLFLSQADEFYEKRLETFYLVSAFNMPDTVNKWYDTGTILKEKVKYCWIKLNNYAKQLHSRAVPHRLDKNQRETYSAVNMFAIIFFLYILSLWHSLIIKHLKSATI